MSNTYIKNAPAYLKLEDDILDIARVSQEMTNSDIQGVLSTVLRKYKIEFKNKIK